MQSWDDVMFFVVQSWDDVMFLLCSRAMTSCFCVDQSMCEVMLFVVQSWDDALARRAQELADTCDFEHALTTL